MASDRTPIVSTLNISLTTCNTVRNRFSRRPFIYLFYFLSFRYIILHILIAKKRCIGPKRLLSPIHQLLPYVQFCASTVIQEALARSLERADQPYEGHPSYYGYLKAKYTRKRDLLVDALTEAGFAVPDYERTPGGGFFILARPGKDIQRLIPEKYLFAKNEAAPGGVARPDWALCQWMAEEVGLLCIPSSPFFSLDRVNQGVSDSFIRVAFCKTDETIEAAAQVLRKLKVPEAVVVD